MNQMDISELAADCDNIIGGLPDHTTRGPIYVTRNEQPEAVIIRHQAYAPRLHYFDVTPNNRLHCILCPAETGTFGRPMQHLGEAVEWANKHWRDHHRERT